MNTKKINAAIAFSAFGGANESSGLPAETVEKLRALAIRIAKTELFAQFMQDDDELEDQMQAQLFVLIEDYLNSEGV
jgi:hypothetical protein